MKTLPREFYFLRGISSREPRYPYNTAEDFTALADVLNYNHRLDAAIAGTDLSPVARAVLITRTAVGMY